MITHEDQIKFEEQNEAMRQEWNAIVDKRNKAIESGVTGPEFGAIELEFTAMQTEYLAFITEHSNQLQGLNP